MPRPRKDDIVVEHNGTKVNLSYLLRSGKELTDEQKTLVSKHVQS